MFKRFLVTKKKNVYSTYFEYHTFNSELFREFSNLCTLSLTLPKRIRSTDEENTPVEVKRNVGVSLNWYLSREERVLTIDG